MIITINCSKQLWPIDNHLSLNILPYDSSSQAFGKGLLKVIPVSEGEASKTLDAPGEYRFKYAWSPNGKELAVFSQGAILAIPIAGGKPRQMLDLKELSRDDVDSLFWSPDGQNLAFIALDKAKGDPGQIFIAPAGGGKVTELAADDLGYKCWLCWSPDGKWISYSSDGFVKTRPGGEIWEADVSELLSGMKKEQ